MCVYISLNGQQYKYGDSTNLKLKFRVPKNPMITQVIIPAKTDGNLIDNSFIP